MSGAIPSLHLYAFMAWKGTTLCNPLPDCYQASSFPFFALSYVCKFNIARIKNEIIVYVPSSFRTLGWCISLHYQTGW